MAKFANTLGEMDQKLFAALQEDVTELSQLIQTEFTEKRLGKQHGRHESYPD